MPTPIEQYEAAPAPKWQEVNWMIGGERVYGVFSELEGSTEKLKKIRLAVDIPQNSENVTLDIKQRNRREREAATGDTKRLVDEEYYIISYWSPGLRIGRLLTIPRELVITQEEGGPIFVQIEELSVYSYDNNNQPTYDNLG